MKQLTDAHIHELSRILDKNHMVTVGLNLGIDLNMMHSIFNQYNSLTDAIQHILLDWTATKYTRQQAYHEMVTGLLKAGLWSIAHCVLGHNN